MAVTQESLAFIDASARGFGAPRSSELLKRVFDVVVALAALIVCSPLLVVLCLLVFVTDPGPVVFRQTRIGRSGARFKIVKFRTMVHDAEARLHNDPVLHQLYLDNDHKIPADIDPRITRIGRFLRATSLDELPQLWNVLAGHMSIVGPRPIVRNELTYYGDDAAYYESVRPGVTGPWQASGRSTLSYAERVRLDVDYVRSWTPLVDVKIVLKTIPAVLLRHGAH